MKSIDFGPVHGEVAVGCSKSQHRLATCRKARLDARGLLSPEILQCSVSAQSNQPHYTTHCCSVSGPAEKGTLASPCNFDSPAVADSTEILSRDPQLLTSITDQ